METEGGDGVCSLYSDTLPVRYTLLCVVVIVVSGSVGNVECADKRPFMIVIMIVSPYWILMAAFSDQKTVCLVSSMCPSQFSPVSKGGELSQW